MLHRIDTSAHGDTGTYKLIHTAGVVGRLDDAGLARVGRSHREGDVVNPMSMASG